MKLFKYVLAMCSVLILDMSCKKSHSNEGLAALNIVNANNNASSVLVYLTDTPDSFYQNRAPIYYGANIEYGTAAGVNPLSIYNGADTVKPLVRATLNLMTGGVYSLFLAGDAPQIDTVFTEDIIPYHKDSAVSVRFINLSPGSQPITVNIEGNPTSQVEFSALSYRQYSDFKTYSATGGITSYNFEIRDQASGDLLTSVTWYFTMFQSHTIVIAGSEDPNASVPINAFQVNNY